jgi:hypothetical protein
MAEFLILCLLGQSSAQELRVLISPSSFTEGEIASADFVSLAMTLGVEGQERDRE